MQFQTAQLQTYADVIATAGEALTAATRSHPEAPVVACPGWSITTLAGHIGGVHGWATAIVGEGATERPPFPSAPTDVDGASMADWADAQREALLSALATSDPQRIVWVFGAQAPASFWWRRQAHETTVHAWDATAAAGDAYEIPGDMGADGLDEFLTAFLPRILRRGDLAWGLGRTVHLHRTDGDGEWLVTIEPSVPISREHAKGDLAVRGRGGDLLLWAMNRPADVEVLGDTALADAWAANVRF